MSRHSKRNATVAYIGTAVCLLLTGGMAWAVVRLALTPEPAIDPDTLCPLDTPPAGYVAIVLDATDAWSEPQTQALRTSIRKIAQGLRYAEKFEVFEIPEALPLFPRPVFSMCSPGNGADANPLNQNARMMQEVFEERFLTPLDGYINTLTGLQEATTTPLLEVLSEISARDDYSVVSGRRVLYLASDMLQNYGGYSQYRSRSYDYADFASSTYAQNLNFDLRGAEINLLYLLNSKTASRQSRQHIDFYRSLLADHGGTVGTVEPL